MNSIVTTCVFYHFTKISLAPHIVSLSIMHLLVLSSNTFYNYSQLRCHYHLHHREGNLCHCPFHHCQCHCHLVIFSLPIFVTFQQPHVHYTNIVALTYKLSPYENTEKNTKVKSQRKYKKIDRIVQSKERSKLWFNWINEFNYGLFYA